MLVKSFEVEETGFTRVEFLVEMGVEAAVVVKQYSEKSSRFCPSKKSVVVIIEIYVVSCKFFPSGLIWVEGQDVSFIGIEKKSFVGGPSGKLSYC